MLSIALIAGLVDCSDDSLGPLSGGADDGGLLSDCDLNTRYVADGGVGRDGIPSLTDPPLGAPGSDGLEYLRDDDRVVGIQVEGQAYAVPHNILWWHEITNLNVGGRTLAVPIEAAYTSFWGSWAAFFPTAELWTR